MPAAFPSAVASLPGFRVFTVGHIARKERRQQQQQTPDGRRLGQHGLFLFHAGSGSFRSERESALIDAGTLLLLRAGTWHRFDPAPGSYLTESWLLFDGPLADRLVADLAGTERCLFRAADPPGLAERWLDLLDLALRGPAADLRVTSLAIDLLVDALGSGVKTGERDDAVALFIRCADQQAAAETCPLEDFLAREQLVFETFRKAFRRRTGLFPRQYWQRRKLDRARHLLTQGGDAVGAVAADCGFADIYHFSRWFRRHAGLSPRAFRERYRT